MKQQKTAPGPPPVSHEQETDHSWFDVHHMVSVWCKHHESMCDDVIMMMQNIQLKKIKSKLKRELGPNCECSKGCRLAVSGELGLFTEAGVEYQQTGKLLMSSDFLFSCRNVGVYNCSDRDVDLVSRRLLVFDCVQRF